MTKEEARNIIDILDKYHNNAKCELNYNNEFQLLIAVILSAQCTDKRVNIITEELFKKVKTPQDIQNMSYDELEKYIYSAGFYKNKAKNIKMASEAIINKFSAKVPENRENLESLPGVGRKTANVVMSVAFNEQAIAVDTHVFRVSNRIGLAKANNPYDCEKQLMKILDKSLWTKAHHILIFQGRYICKSQKPNCLICPITQNCRYYKKEMKNVFR